MRRGILSTLAAATALLAPAAPAAAAPAVAGEFALPGANTVGSDNEIVAGPDGNMWVTTETNSVVRVGPDGSMTPFPLAADAFGITTGPDGNLWASQSVGVAKINPATGAAQEIPIGGGYANGRGITAGPDGKIWIVGTNTLTRIDPANPAVGQDVNAIAAANPKGMTTGSDGLLWFANGNTVVSATAADTPVLTPYAIENAAGQGGAQDVAAGLNGQVAYANPVDTPQGVGLITPGGTPQKIPLENSDPFGVAFGADQAYWVARSQTNDLLRLAADGSTTTLGGFAPSGGVGPRKLAAGPGNTLWVTLDTPEKIGKVTGVDPPATDPIPDPDPAVAPKAEITTGPPDRAVKEDKRAKVKIAFVADVAGASFECSLKKKGERTEAEDRLVEFKPCTSPKKYKRLRIGKYKFKVRATAGGLVGPPDSQRFKVVEKQQ